MAKKVIQIMDTTYRDGFQSVFGGRVLLEDFLPSIEAAMDAGIKHFEAGGGARFQALFFYLNENAFDMMDAIRAKVGPDIKLQTLARGVNTVSLDTGSREMIDLHAQMFAKHGISHIRNFDALNDVRNLEYSAKAIKDAGLHHEMVVTVMDLPPGCTGAHDVAFYEKTLRSYLDAGVPYDSICFKDASGTAHPQKIYETFQMARKLVGEEVHLRYHTQETANISVAQYMAAIEGGADGIDLARDPVSGGTSQPDFLVMRHATKGKDYVLGNHLGEEFNWDKILESEMVLKECLKDYFMPPEAKEVSPLIQYSPMPGGALTANTQMMRDNNCLDKFTDVIAEMREVVEKGGYGTSVTPVSQFYFQQAFNNVLFGKWEKIAKDYGRMVLGYFGKTPVAPDPKIVTLASEQLNMQPTTDAAIDIASKDEAKSRAHAESVLKENGLETTDENCFIYLACGDKGIKFLKGEAAVNVRKKSDMPSGKPGKPGEYTVNVGGQTYNVVVAEGHDADIKSITPVGGKAVSATAATPASATAGGATVEVPSPLPGSVFKLVAKEGDSVSEGQTVMILEAMKMETEIRAPINGTVASVHVGVGDTVESGQSLMSIYE